LHNFTRNIAEATASSQNKTVQNGKRINLLAQLLALQITIMFMLSSV